MRDTRIRPRRLLILFLATTVVPTVSLVWVGWRQLELDRREEASRISTRLLDARDHAADLAASTLQRLLAEAEERLTAFSAAPDVPVSLGDGATLLLLGTAGVEVRAGTPLPWYPAVPTPSLATPASFPGGDLEHRAGDLNAAFRALAAPAFSPDRAVRGEALLRRARIQSRLGNLPAALALFDELGALEGERISSGMPAGLAARLGRAALFERAGRAERLHDEAEALRRDLGEGRWPLTRTEFEAAHLAVAETIPASPAPPQERPGAEAHGSSFGPAADVVDPDRVALAEVADWLWRERHNSEWLQSRRGRRLRRAGDRSILVLTRASPERLAAMLMAPAFLESRWLNELRSAGTSEDIDFALTDADGPVLGPVDIPLARQAMRLTSTTQLPWTVHAISVEPAPGPGGLSASTRLLLAGIAMMALLVVAVGLFINRTVVRELTVARLQADFVAAVSHEFRTPLTTMRQLSEMLVRGRISSDARRHEFYQTLLRESERLHKLVEGVLDFKRFDVGGAAYRFETIDAGGLVRSVVAEFETRVAPQGFRIELSAPDGDLRIRADRDALTRAIWNLLDNAVKYSPECRRVWVDLRAEAGQVSIAVRDRGLGIPAPEREAIFERFVRGAESKTRHIAGTGIGLALARTIVQAHGGEIRLASEPGQGSQFTMVLRAADGAP